ncbi:hypothetical protein CLV59_10695 [Chitinophaga dinghuensis]|uniref:DUF4377 domain-containing protein n=1 Tax=Chitinophaga dinghuensis TaxID=1539050 RepID=A0A327VVP3_9BACT|nr:hypothetical protein [Chitinophaga dinghuensis]RAJ79035.1 hypothetical protein CLV59_10695 [Chitinophaga dinghuensis]
MMKPFYLLLALTLLFVACRKENFDANSPKDGQVISLFVDHYITGGDGHYFLNTDRNVKLNTYVQNFERELGYTYVIKAKVVRPNQPPQDGPSYWFEYQATLNKEKYVGKDTLTLPVFGFVAPSDAVFLRKVNGTLLYLSTKLIPANDNVKATLDSIYNAAPQILDKQPRPNFALKVQYAPNDYSSYIVHSVKY